MPWREEGREEVEEWRRRRRRRRRRSHRPSPFSYGVMGDGIKGTLGLSREKSGGQSSHELKKKLSSVTKDGLGTKNGPL